MNYLFNRPRKSDTKAREWDMREIQDGESEMWEWDGESEMWEWDSESEMWVRCERDVWVRCERDVRVRCESEMVRVRCENEMWEWDIRVRWWEWNMRVKCDYKVRVICEGKRWDLKMSVLGHHVNLIDNARICFCLNCDAVLKITVAMLHFHPLYTESNIFVTHNMIRK